MSTPTAKKRQRTSSSAGKPVPEYSLIYWPEIPGRGEHIRLAFEEAGVAYTDVGNDSAKGGVKAVLSQISPENLGDAANPPPLAPPILEHGGLRISQTSNILMYLGPHLDLVPSTAADAHGAWHVNALALTALDGLSNEAHDTHHPIASSVYYEDQKDAAKLKAQAYRTERIPKFLDYFERVLRGDASAGGEWLYQGGLTYADLVLFHTIDGLNFAFPKCMKRMRDAAKYEKVFALYERVKARPRIKAYLASERRQKYGQGIYRFYPELDED